MEFKVGDSVWVEAKRNERRRGRVLGIYPRFVLIWVYARFHPYYGWRECFLWHDVELGIVAKEKTRLGIVGKLRYSHNGMLEKLEEKLVGVGG